MRGIFAGGIAGSILGFLPGMGPAQGSILAQELSGGGDIGENREGFLVAMSGVNVSDTLFSLIAIYLIGNPRSGIAVFIDKLIQNFDVQLSSFIYFCFDYSCISVGFFLFKTWRFFNFIYKLRQLHFTFKISYHIHQFIGNYFCIYRKC